MRIPFFIAIVLILTACSSKKSKPDVSKINVQVQIKRFDKDFFTIDTTHIDRSLQGLANKYPSFLPLYFEYFSPVDFIIRQEQKPYETAVLEYYRNIKPLYDSVQKKYADLSKVEKDLETNFRYLKYYFPSFRIPAVLASVESLNPENPMEIYGTTYYHDSLIVSLQMFMGNHFSVYDPAQYPDYIRRRFEQPYIVPNCFRAITGDLYDEKSEGAPLIEQMVEKGKQWWLLSKLLPDSPDSLITGYSKQQTEWVKANEGNIWGYINQNENLYAIEQTTIQTYIGEAPFTSTLPHGNSGEGAPGNIGPWVGWQIIEAYTEQHPRLSVQQVLATPARKLFTEAKYRPK
jgi:hypothetical protein